MKIVRPLLLQVLLFSLLMPLQAQQTPWHSVNSILAQEGDSRKKQYMKTLATYIQDIYGNAGTNIQKGGKITIFIDPAHGLLPDGRWQGGDATGRSSVRDLPEEYYSIRIARRLYTHLLGNRFINVISTNDYMKVLRGESEEYKNIPFSETVTLAREKGAFIIISEHLNNVASWNKATNDANITGIHVVYSSSNVPMLRYIPGSHKGFLTLYNKLDASGFSRVYAHKLKNHLVAQGLRANNWEQGAVGDDRFSYFTDFPISVIYESGFISNPQEEALLSDPLHQEKLALWQYTSLLETLRDAWGIDISREKPVIKENALTSARVELLLLSRMAVYYIGKGDTAKTTKTISLLKQRASASGLAHQVSYYSQIQQRINRAESYHRKALYYRRRNWNTSQRYTRLALGQVQNNHIYHAYRDKYLRLLPPRRGGSSSSARRRPTERVPEFKSVTPSPVTKPLVLAIEAEDTLRQSIQRALGSDEATAIKVEQSLRRYRVQKWRKVRVWSQQQKKMVHVWRKYQQPVVYRRGIYVVKLNSAYRVRSVQRVNSVTLDPNQYQNAQFLRNSCFTEKERHRSL